MKIYNVKMVKTEMASTAVSAGLGSGEGTGVVVLLGQVLKHGRDACF